MNTVGVTLACFCVLAICSLSKALYIQETEEPASPCTGSPTLEWLPHPTNCSRYYICWGAEHFELSCGRNTSWQPRKKVCVLKGSPDDICPCENRLSGTFGHPTKCAQYYNCSAKTYQLHPGQAYRYLDECRFPDLFSTITGKCEHYTQVDCGFRVEAKNPCDYERNHCSRSIHCPPCPSRFPDCTGFPDGANIWKERIESPYFCICKDERMISYDGYCSGSRIFHPIQRRCVDAKTYFENKP